MIRRIKGGDKNGFESKKIWPIEKNAGIIKSEIGSKT